MDAPAAPAASPRAGPSPTPGSPAARGFRMPAEWEPQESVWLAWPRDPVTWPDRLERVREVYLEAIRHVALAQRVDLVVHPELASDVRDRLRGLDTVRNVRLHPVEHQDSWIRDYGPTYVVDSHGGRLAVKWGFNAWGNKYESLLFDDGVVDRLGAASLGADEVVRAPLVLEGGSIEVDGEGTLLTTEQCLLHPNRNPELDKAAIEALLRDHLGAQKVLWLGEGIEGDDTDGHVDDITRFVGPATVVTTVAPTGHPDHVVLRDNLARLRDMRDALGRPLTVHTLPAPPRIEADGEPLPASHANFLVTDACVLMPAFGGPSDAAALDVLQACFPDRPVVPLDSRDLVWGMGAVHCLSQQMPARAGRGGAAA